MSSGAYEDDGDAVIEMDLLPPRWLDVQDEVTELLADIAKQTRKLDQLHQKHVLPGFDDEHVKKREEQEIEQLTQAITRNFQKCQQAIKRIETMVREAKQQGNINQGEEIMAQNLKISLATRVGEVSAMFRKKQAAYLKSVYYVCYTMQGWLLTLSQKCAISAVSHPLSVLPRLSKILITILHSRSRMPTDRWEIQHSCRPSNKDCATIRTKP